MLAPDIFTAAAIRSKNFEALLTSRGRRDLLLEFYHRWPTRTIAFLLQRHQFELVDQLPTDLQQREMVVALKTGSRPVIEYVQSRGVALPAAAFDLVAGTSDVDVLQWLYQQGQRPTEVAITHAARYGRLDNVQWLVRQAQVPPTSHALVAAAYGGHVGVLSFLVSVGVQLEPRVAVAAAKRNHLNVLEWLYDRGVEFNAMVYTYAVANGAAETIEFLKSLVVDDDMLIENGLETCGLGETRVHNFVRNSVVVHAARVGNLAIVQQYFTPSYGFNTRALNKAVAHGHYDVVMTLLDRGVSSGSVLETAATHGHVRLVKVLLDRRRHDYDYQQALIATLEVVRDNPELCSHSADEYDEIIRLLFEVVEPSSVVLRAVILSGYRDLEEQLLQQGVMVDVPVLQAYACMGRVVDQMTSLPREQVSKLLDAAVKSGHLNVIEHLTNGADRRFSDLLALASEHGQLRVVNWLLARSTSNKGLSRALNAAAVNGYVGVLTRLQPLAPEWKIKMDSAVAATNYLDIVRLTPPRDLCALLEALVVNNRLALVQHALDNDCIITGIDLDRAAIHGRLAILLLLHQHTSERCSRGAYLLANECGYKEIVKYLQQVGFNRRVGAWFTYDDYEQVEVDDLTDETTKVLQVVATGSSAWYSIDKMSTL